MPGSCIAFLPARFKLSRDDCVPFFSFIESPGYHSAKEADNCKVQLTIKTRIESGRAKKSAKRIAVIESKKKEDLCYRQKFLILLNYRDEIFIILFIDHKDSR